MIALPLLLSLLASSALGSPTSKASPEIIARLQEAHASRRAARAESEALSTRASPLTSKLRSTTWSGGVISDGKTHFKSVSAELTIPNVTFPYGYDKSRTYLASAWVGISGFGDLCGHNDCAVWQVGFYYMYNPEGDFGAYPFYEWFPGPVKFMDDVIKSNNSALVGHTIRMTVTLDGTNKAGTATFEDLTTGQKVEKTDTAPALGGLDSSMAEWIVETFMKKEDHKTLYPDYGTLTWNNIAATAVDGTKMPLTNAGAVNAEPFLDGRFMTDCSVDAAKASTSCKWLGYKNIFPDA